MCYRDGVNVNGQRAQRHERTTGTAVVVWLPRAGVDPSGDRTGCCRLPWSDEMAERTDPSRGDRRRILTAKLTAMSRDNRSLSATVEASCLGATRGETTPLDTVRQPRAKLRNRWAFAMR